jgi:hypothetical protein
MDLDTSRKISLHVFTSARLDERNCGERTMPLARLHLAGNFSLLPVKPGPQKRPGPPWTRASAYPLSDSLPHAVGE